MLRFLVAAVVTGSLSVGTLAAAELKGTIVKFDVKKKTLVVAVAGQDHEVLLADDTACECLATGVKFQFAQGKQVCAQVAVKGMPVNVSTASKDGKEVATKLQFDPPVNRK